MLSVIMIVVAFVLSVSPVASPLTENEKILAGVIYAESRGEPFKGQIAVGHTVLNRVRDKRWPSTVEGVVFQRSQFAYSPNKDRKIGLYAKLINRGVLKDWCGATYFHATHVRPNWSYRFTITCRIGNHIFYN